MRNLRSLVSLVLALVGILSLATRPARAGDQDFQLYNRTGVDIYHLYVSPSQAEAWEEDLLGGNQLLNGADVTVSFSPSTSAELWDLRIEDSDGDYLYWRGLNLLEISEIILENNGKARVK